MLTHVQYGVESILFGSTACMGSSLGSELCAMSRLHVHDQGVSTIYLQARAFRRRRNGGHWEAQQPQLLGRPAPLQLTGGPPKKAPGAFIAGFVPAEDVVRLPFYPPPAVPKDFVARHQFPPPPPPRPASGEAHRLPVKAHAPQHL